MSPAVALFVAVTLAVSAVCIAVRVRVWWRARAARNRAAWYEAQAAAERDPGRRGAWRLLALLDDEVEQPPQRRRLAVAVFPLPAVVFAEHPRPDCEACHGVGGWPDGELEAVCPCWDPAREVRLLPLPLWVGRRMWRDAGRAER